MNDFIVHGNGVCQMVDVNESWDQRNGGTTTATYVSNTGTTSNVMPTDMVNVINSLVSQNWSYQATQEKKGGKWTLVATYPASLLTDPLQQRIPEVQWDIEPYEINQAMFDCNDREFIANLSTTTKALIDNAIKYPTGTMPLTTPQDIAQLPNATIAYNLKAIGVEAREIDSLTLKRSIIVPRWYNPSWSIANNGYILALHYLLNYYAVPTWVAWCLPASDTSIQEDVNGVSTFYGYREYRPERHNVPGNRVQISQVWKYNKWSAGTNGLYDVIGL